MKTNPALLRAVLAMGAGAGLVGTIAPHDEHRPTPSNLRRNEDRKRKEREAARARAEQMKAKAEAKRRRKALKLAALTSERKP